MAPGHHRNPDGDGVDGLVDDCTDSQSQPLIVVGAGVAGLCTALAAAPHPVIVLSRCSDGTDCATALAQGGIAAALSASDNANWHARDTVAAGAGVNSAEAVAVLTSQARSAIDWLRALGVPFDLHQEGSATGSMQLALEGGHGCARVAHAEGDRSGAVLLAALRVAVRRASHIRWHADQRMQALQLQGRRVTGVRCLDSNALPQVFEGCSVVFATGGIGALFADSTNPATADGSGLALAMAAGAEVRDLEFIQFHPTALAVASDAHGRLPLITEALRGAGACLRNHAGERLMAAHPSGDLAPRDVVARAVQQASLAGPVWLDAGQVPDLADRFPGAYALCREHGIDPATQMIPVRAAVHFHMGGIACDLDGRSSLAGLFAVGEVACSGVHGANRLASNSLLEGVVFGRRVARAATSVAPPCTRDHVRWVEPRDAAAHALLRLRHLLSTAMGPLRDGQALQQALHSISTDSGLRSSWQAMLASAVVRGALLRTHSLGAHYRSDAAAAAPTSTAINLPWAC